MSKKRKVPKSGPRDAPSAAEPAARIPRPALIALFVLALACRLLYWQATEDASWPHSAFYKGDAWVWLEQARSIELDREHDYGLPLRPPGMPYFLAAVWDGELSQVGRLRLLWCLLGAIGVVGFAAAAARVVGSRGGLAVGLICAASMGLLRLGSSLNNETLYLLLLAGIFWLTPRLAPGQTPQRKPGPAISSVRRTGGGATVGWGALNGLACLVRVEHALFFGLALLWLAFQWSRGSRRAAGVGAAVTVGAAALVMLPWHLSAWESIRKLNDGPVEVRPEIEQAQRRQEQILSVLAWEPEAQEAREAMPAFSRRPAANFVAATVAFRGRRTITLDDLKILEEAFGYTPQRLDEHPFVVLSGGLNFALANHAGATGGFSPELFRRPPPLAGGRDSYPPSFITGIPPRDLSFSYPSHLKLVNDGYEIGARWATENPREAIALARRKLELFWSGAALGLTTANLPLGESGVRQAVDLVAAEGWVATVWRYLLLVATIAGLLILLRKREAVVWALFLGSKVIVTVLFYGYARQGATVVPVIALLVVAAASGLLRKYRPSERRVVHLAALAAGVILAVDVARYLAKPTIQIDGKPITAAHGRSPDDHDEHRVTVRW